MKKFNVSMSFVLFFSIVLMCSATAAIHAQSAAVDKVEVPLTDPSKPAEVRISVITGSITVTGYNGKTVIVEAAAKIKEHGEEKEEEGEEEEPNKKTKGMFRIRNNSTGLNVEEENNVVEVKTQTFNRKIDLTLKVPFKTSLKLRAVNNGEVTVEKVEGDLNVNHVNGPVTLKDVGGTVVANTVNGDLTVSFENVSLDKPMSFSTFNGDVDVTFPASAKFNLKLKTDRGEIYSDFELNVQASPVKARKMEKKEKGKFVVTFDKAVHALLNGGGEEATFKTFNGDIYIRKRK